MLPALTNPKATTHHHVRLDNRNNNNSNNSNNNNNNRSNGNNSQSNINNNNNNNSSNSTKRNTSMIFRIEQLLPSAATTATAMTRSARESLGAAAITSAATEAATTTLASTCTASGSASGNGNGRLTKQRSGVYVSQQTPKDTLSEPIATHALIAQTSAEPPNAMRTYCTLSQRVLCMTPTILRRIKLAEDVPSYNALFELHGDGGQVRVRIIRDIARDEEIVAWFGDELTMLMAIPFLTPLHIQSNSRYTCHLCQLTFETPNPLKVHLALACGRHSMDLLWIRLHYAVRAATAAAAAAAAAAHQLLPPAPALATGPASPAVARFSAFKPITPGTLSPHAAPLTVTPPSTISLSLPPPPPPPHTASIQSSLASSSPSLSMPVPSLAASTTTLTFLPTMTTMSLAPAMSLLAPPPIQHSTHPTLAAAQHPVHHPPQSSQSAATLHGNNPLNAAAQIEAIVSNMGASKQGHLCIYCGKVYSRKYGLKIHIRTHTGFKPLKCKFCLRPFGDPSNLNKHVRLHLQTSSGSGSNNNTTIVTSSGGVGTTATVGEFAGNVVEGFKCHLCHKTLARRRDLQRHIETRHHHQTTITSTAQHSHSV